MRLTIRSLLLIFPAFFVGVFAARVLDSGCVLYYWGSAFNEARSLQGMIKINCAFPRGKPVPVDAIDQWLAGKLPANHPLARKLWEPPDKDPWGNPYRCVRRLDGETESFGIYSTGLDGVTKSDGNDPDDLNSWNEHCYLGYAREGVRRDRIRYALQGAVFAAIFFSGMLGCTWCVRWLRKLNLSTQPSRPSAGDSRPPSPV